MLSVLPSHIAEKVRADIHQSGIDNSGSIPGAETNKRPFTGLYLETHAEASMLFADIVNFTPLTAQLEVGHLVQLLNELFRRFDEASEVSKFIVVVGTVRKG